MVYIEGKLPDTCSTTLSDRERCLERLTAGRSDEESALIALAFDMAEKAHAGQTRISGEPYLTHVIGVADILVGLKMDHESIAVALLHDTVEDTELTLEEIEEACGSSVAHLVDGVTKMKVMSAYKELQEEEGRKRRESIHAESQRKMLLAMAEDVRVVLIKLADRLYNMRTLKHLRADKQRRIASETMDIYAPLANRLGIWQVKWELEDLSLRYLKPETYKEIAQSLDERRVDRERFIDDVVERLRSELQTADIKGDVKGRPKHIFSIWKKMRRKGLGFHELYDVRAVRILVESVTDCYHVLGIVHTLWSHIPKEFDDYIATPKENQYQSIHTAVVGPMGKTLEVQIRTHDMEKHAELGVAAHWRYKEGGAHDRSFEQKVAWLRQLLEWKDEESDAGDFIDRFKSEAFQDRIYVLSPDGMIVDLPHGATPLDFAYHIHTMVGHRCRGAKVDGRIVPITYNLQSGEGVEILTGKHPAPSRDWLSPHLGYLKSSRARAKVRHWFNEQDQQQNLDDGRTLLERELRRLGCSDLPLERFVEHFHKNGIDELLIDIGRSTISTAQISSAIHHLTEPEPNDEEAQEALLTKHRREGDKGGDISISGVGNLMTSMARCCKPAPGDDIVGYITRGRGVTIHRTDCTNMLNLKDEDQGRVIEVAWAGWERNTYPVDIQIEAIDRPALLKDITTVLANEHANVLAMNTLTDTKKNSALMKLTIEIADTDQLSRVVGRLSQLPNVLEARRSV
ncbi:GTP diphosphokinase [Solemya pervernicosa gill symbiont]|uniref:GTP pyrophosphokinase n=2 Tax=Gammaproteobacteria incertae sedis TaxID=118884 RepID=A0A1T2L030_9GAMM|nr:GTP diphosphokinase [Candidatus Reidiella endopervernicosa]OOZ38431.1 GTP diphosphokinase [Solemya pervernicosa gill symbiont]QKQ27859.1 GTP diphosphokinase [Candidatus Reidiella endopervernicosa]